MKKLFVVLALVFAIISIFIFKENKNLKNENRILFNNQQELLQSNKSYSQENNILRNKITKLGEKINYLEYCKRSPIEIYSSILNDEILVSANDAWKASSRKFQIK